MLKKKKPTNNVTEAIVETPLQLTTQTVYAENNDTTDTVDTQQKRKKFSLLHLYDEITLATRLQEANKSSFCVEGSNDANNISVDFISTVAGDIVTYYYYVNKYPRNLPLNFKMQLRQACGQHARVLFMHKMQPHKMDLNSSRMRSKLRVLAHIGEETDSKSVNAYNIHESIEDIQRQQWVEDSLVYYTDAHITRGCGLFKSTVLIQVTGKRGVLFDDSVKKFLECAKRIGLTLERVLFEIPDVVRATSPFKRTIIEDVLRNTPVQVLTDEIAARFSTYTQGVTGKKGLYFGTDVHTNSPVFKQVKRTAEDAEVWLVTAQTGGGKSFYTKMLLLQLIATGCNCTILDVEGKEYLNMARFLSHNSKVLVVNLGEGTGRYFDPLAIAKPIGNIEIDSESRKMSVEYTTATLKVLLGRKYDESTWFDTVISDVVAYTYRKAGVTDDPKTWTKSRDLTLHHVYANLQFLIGTQNNTEYDVAVQNMITWLKKYFAPDGIRADMFKQRISIGEVAEADLVICSFGMAGRDPSTVDETQMNLMQLGAAQFSHQRSIFSCARGKYNVKVWEEVQRWGAFKGSESVLKTAITGGRKLGDISIVVTNDIGALLDKDPFALINNSTSRFIGKLNDTHVIKRLCETLAVPELENELLQVMKATQKKIAGGDMQGAQSPYDHAFMCLLGDGNNAVTKMLLPKSISSLKLFYTGV